GSAEPGYDDGDFSRVTLPHTVVPLSWGDWDPADWERVWIYRRRLRCSVLTGSRVFAHFDGIMVNATAVVNGTVAGRHKGGYLPWSVELTDYLVPGDNVLAVIVDSRWLPVPPSGARRGAKSVDYLQPGGIYRDAKLRVLPGIFLADLFARPADVLSASPNLDVRCTVDAALAPPGQATITAELLDGTRKLATASTTFEITEADVASRSAAARVNLSGIEGVRRWSPDCPKLYAVTATLAAQAAGGAAPIAHTASVRTGFREARFEPEGFYLNGERLKIFGLNRHQLFP